MLLLNWLNNHIYKNRNKDFIFDPRINLKLSYKELFNLSYHISKQIISEKIHKKPVGLLFTNDIEFIISFFALLISGTVIVPINPKLSYREKKFIIKNSSINYIFSKKEYNNLKTKKLVKKIYNFNYKKNQFVKINNKNTNNTIIKNNKTLHDLMFIYYTSGTTGNPKGVCHSLNNFIINSKLFGNIYNINSKSIFLNCLPLSYLGGSYNLLLIPFINNSQVVLVDEANTIFLSKLLYYIKKYKINNLWLVPTLINLFLYINKEKNKKILSNQLKFLYCGTAPLNENIKNLFEKKYSIPILQNYGISETLFISAQKKYSKQSNNLGQIFNGVDATIGKLNNNHYGEFLIKSKNLFKGYFVNGKCKFIKNKWFSTGDVGYIKNKKIYLNGRFKDIIIKNGINISARAIENIILEMNIIFEVAVVGIEDKFCGERIIVYYSLKNNKNNKNIEKKIYNYCKNNLSIISFPDKIIYKDLLPKTVTGKIKKNDLIKNYISDI